MIKHSTVIKRIFQDSWRFVLSGILFGLSLIAIGKLSEFFFGWAWYETSQVVFFITLFVWGLKEAYDWKKTQIKWEQEDMLRKLGKKDD